MSKELEPLKQELFSYLFEHPKAVTTLRDAGFGRHLDILYKGAPEDAVSDFVFYQFVKIAQQYLGERIPRQRRKLERKLVQLGSRLSLYPPDRVLATILDEDKPISDERYEELLESVGMHIARNPPLYTRAYQEELERVLQRREHSEKELSIEASSAVRNELESSARYNSESLIPAEGHQLLKEQVERVVSSLNDQERRVLELRFGLVKPYRSRTLEEVGKEFGVTRERIRQIEAKALRKIRHPSRSKKLRDFLE